MARWKSSEIRTGCGCGIALLLFPLLAEMLMPARGRARDSLRFSQCIQNLKTIAVAMQFYQEDYGGYLPPDVLPTLLPYLGDQSPAYCAEHDKPYVYLPRGRMESLASPDTPSMRVCAYCPGPHPADDADEELERPSYCFLFLDGHVECVPEDDLPIVIQRVRRALREESADLR